MCNTYRIPHSTSRSGNGLRPGYRKRRARCGSSGSRRSHRQWEYLPKELGFGSGMTCQRLAAAARGPAGRTERGRTSGLVPLYGRLFPRQDTERGQHTGPSPVDRGRAGSTHHLITDGRGTPLAVLLTAATATTSPSSCPCSTRSRRSAAGLVILAGNRTRCSPTAATTTTSTATRSAPAASWPRSPVAAPSTAPDWAPTAGLWRLPGCTAFDACESAAASRHPRSNPQTRLLSHHPSATQGIVLTPETLGTP